MDRFPGDDARTQLIDLALAAHEAVDADPVTEVTAIVDALLGAPEALVAALGYVTELVSNGYFHGEAEHDSGMDFVGPYCTKDCTEVLVKKAS